MTAAKPKPGETYTYTADKPLGTDPGAIPPGTKVTVREVVKAATTGAHDDTEDAAVVETTEGRAWSVGLSDLKTNYTKES